jgi:hypothetical protein
MLLRVLFSRPCRAKDQQAVAPKAKESDEKAMSDDRQTPRLLSEAGFLFFLSTASSHTSKQA